MLPLQNTNQPDEISISDESLKIKTKLPLGSQMQGKEEMHMTPDNKPERTVKTNIGEMPLEDYLDIRAMQFGFDSYEDMRKQGYSIDIPETN